MPVRSASTSGEPLASPQVMPLMQDELPSFREAFLKNFEATPAAVARDYHRIPDSVAHHLATRDVVFLPSGQGLTVGVLLLPRTEAGQEGAPRQAQMVLLLSALGQNALSSNWLWVQQALARGMAVLAIALDGHSASAQALFDPRLATRTLPLVIDRLFRLPSVPVLHVIGHGFGATLAWLAACRPDAALRLRSVACLSPWCVWQGRLESESEWPPVGQPLRFCRDGLRLARLYGPLGVARMWRGDSVKTLRRKLFAGTSLEAQMAVFLQESIRVSDLLTRAEVPVLVVLPGRGVKASQFSDQDVLGVRGLVTVRCDTMRTARATQFSDAWPPLVFSFLESGGAASNA